MTASITWLGGLCSSPLSEIHHDCVTYTKKWNAFSLLLAVTEPPRKVRSHPLGTYGGPSIPYNLRPDLCLLLKMQAVCVCGGGVPQPLLDPLDLQSMEGMFPPVSGSMGDCICPDPPWAAGKIPGESLLKVSQSQGAPRDSCMNRT